MSSPIQIRNTIPLNQPIQRLEQEQRLKEAAQMYERHFLNEMVKAMRKTVPEGEGLVPSSFAQKLYRDQLDDKYVESWSQQGGVGLADMIFKQLKERVLGSEMITLPPQGPVPLPGSVKPLALPLQEEVQEPLPLKGVSLLLEPNADLESSAARSVTSPWSGRVLQSFQSPEGRVMMKISHADGVESILNYVGSGLAFERDQSLQAGQKLGQLDIETKGLVWTVTKNGQRGA